MIKDTTAHDPYSLLHLTQADLSDLTDLDHYLKTEKDDPDLEVLDVVQAKTREPRKVQVV